MKTLCFFLFIIWSSSLHASNCSRNGQSLVAEGWSPAIRRVCFTDSISQNVFTSPDSQKRLLVDKSGFSFFVSGKRIAWTGGSNLDADGSEISWSPTSSAFFISDGGGCGLDGWTIHVFSVSGSQLLEHDEINGRIVSLFRGQFNCSKAAADPNVRGLGWGKDGTSLLAFAQSTVSESCGAQGDLRGFAVMVGTGAVSRVLSEKETKAYFHNLLPFNMR
jgi:hypothetical protein